MFRYLKSAGAIGEIVRKPMGEDNPSVIEREALLVYAGTFLAKGDADNPDGIEVTVSADQIKNLVNKHNGVLGKIKRFLGGLSESLAMKYYPPIQLDHSCDAAATVGRLIGPVKLVKHRQFDGSEVDGIMGVVRIMGSENVQRVADGRWTHLSVGCDFEEGRFSEVSITPFPAASQASFLTGQQDKIIRLAAFKKEIRLSKFRADIRKLAEEKSRADRTEKLRLEVLKIKELHRVSPNLSSDADKTMSLSALRSDIRLYALNKLRG